MKKTLFFVFILMLITANSNAQFFGGIPQRSDCSDIRSGVCLDKDDGKLYVWNGSAVVLATTASGAVSAEGGVVFNETGADVNFRIESDNSQNAFFIEGGTGQIGIGTATPLVNTILHIYSIAGSSQPAVLLENETGYAVGPIISLYLNSESPADNDILGKLDFFGEDSVSTKTEYANITSQSLDVTTTDTAGSFNFNVRMDNTLRSLLYLKGYNGAVNQGTITINDDSQDVDFIIESDNLTEAFKVQGSDGAVTINGSAVATSATLGAAYDTEAELLALFNARRLKTTKLTKSFVIDTPTATDDFLIWRTPVAITITDIQGVLASGTNVVGGLHFVDSDGSGNETAVDEDITFNGGVDEDDGTLTNAAVAANKWVKWKTTSVDAPGFFNVTIWYTED